MLKRTLRGNFAPRQPVGANGIGSVDGAAFSSATWRLEVDVDDIAADSNPDPGFGTFLSSVIGARLELTKQHQRDFAEGTWWKERETYAILSLIKLGRVEEAKARTERFFKSAPKTPRRRRIEAALAGDGK